LQATYILEWVIATPQNMEFAKIMPGRSEPIRQNSVNFRKAAVHKLSKECIKPFCPDLLFMVGKEIVNGLLTDIDLKFN